MSAARIDDTPVTQPHVIEPVPQTNGSKNHIMAPPRRETPPLRQDNLADAMAVLVQSMAEEREERREQRAITQALIAKLANGANGTSKVKTVIQTVVAVIGIVLIIGAYVVSISSDRTVQQMKVQTLEEKAAKAEKLEQDVRKLEKLYMVRFGVDPADDAQKLENKRR